MDDLIKTTKLINPMCYAYTHPGIPYHDGYIKIGYTEDDVDTRIRNQNHTAGIKYKKEWAKRAAFEDGELFKDTDFHVYLRKNGIKQPQDLGNPYFDADDRNEWFQTDAETSKSMFNDFRENKGMMESEAILPFIPREEQQNAIEKTAEYFLSYIPPESEPNKRPEFLWNAKPRFGKTASTYELAKKLDAKRVLVITNRPVISTSWYDDYVKFVGTSSGYYFVSEVDALKDKQYVYTRDEYISKSNKTKIMGCICFVSLQDLKGSIYFGGKFDKLKYIADLKWDLLVIDEAHEGVDTYKTDTALRYIHRKYTLHLSGTPFKAIANDKFGSDAIYNWSYADEQKAKKEWNNDKVTNPYLSMPKLNMLTYKMSDAIRERIEQGADFNDDGDADAFFFDMNEFFKTTESGKFIHAADVDKFLDALTTKKNFPFTETYRDEIKHTLWIVGSDVPTRSAKALVDKLNKHEVFKHYKIVPAFGGNGWDDDSEESEIFRKEQKDAFQSVKDAIAKYDRTITVSVRKLTTGITVPEWTAVMMLTNWKSASQYIQATFRVQNPYTFNYGTEAYRKENCYVFDFDPARTLNIYEQFANDLYSNTSNGRGDTDTRKRNIRELLNYFPIYSEDEDGEMELLDENKVLSIPRTIHAQEVVRKGFMSNFLFQNISGIFSAPAVVREIINKFEAVKEPIRTIPKASDLDIDENGEVEIPEKTIIGLATELFGEKIYSDVAVIEEEVSAIIETTETKPLDNLKKALYQTTDSVIADGKAAYGEELSKTLQNRVTRDVHNAVDEVVEKTYDSYRIEQNKIELERKKALEQAEIDGRTSDIVKINEEAQSKHKKNSEEFQANIQSAVNDLIDVSEKTVVKATETSKKEAEKKSIETEVRNHLRGFSRTIPSFLMGYGDENTTLENFDTVVPEDVFLEVTGITIKDFRFLRDGGEYPDPDDPTQMKHFDGHLFEPVVFNDSITEFLRKRDSLADYFSDDVTEDIFDYIPPQKTNQIFTPKRVVKDMVDYLEQENPGCFDNPDKTFIDLYMKSGLYITEIVKRLYRSDKMKELYPNEDERLKHIFEKQVYGLAPTEIIYAISTHYILGFAEEHSITISSEHFKLLDALPYAQGKMDMTLEQKLDELFGGEVSATD